ncbi:cytidine/deoxycytidylate deaminase family protein [Halanaerobiaceae bacterium Z-7014]|uniref:Cytidine/deoxycytidylate deaminase family protein n=1 Tax=Halonatronomonas betaini TaxID=2778430 RepID=A0A931AX43_9FIRM|nr:cytidine/deoxycytidylate deaminase family protein [Halonatronomonas betaini]MBF8436418.1 cytidine/deoxycytidylate deaminase family protein [Halonatronomonas betaini]
MDRPDWDEYFMEMAELAAKRATCLRRKVGAVLVKNKKVLATGYNGAPMNIEHCESTGCLREKMEVPSGERHEICRGVHAEQNLVAQAAIHGVKTENSIVYCTHQPCIICTKILINAGVKKIYFKNSYSDKFAENLLKKSNIEFIKYNN